MLSRRIVRYSRSPRPVTKSAESAASAISESPLKQPILILCRSPNSSQVNIAIHLHNSGGADVERGGVGKNAGTDNAFRSQTVYVCLFSAAGAREGEVSPGFSRFRMLRVHRF